MITKILLIIGILLTISAGVFLWKSPQSPLLSLLKPAASQEEIPAVVETIEGRIVSIDEEKLLLSTKKGRKEYQVAKTFEIYRVTGGDTTNPETTPITFSELVPGQLVKIIVEQETYVMGIYLLR
jgi:hypothetical protein